jgi:uncharacterized protein YbbC (DUF1343 family)
LAEYLPLLNGKKIGLIVNQTSRVGDSLLLDMLHARNINITRIFVPEHGFRGEESAGADISSGIDSATGVRIVSLYGKKQKPDDSDLAGLDLMVYDLQDVGVRFYTYISTMQNCMEACAAAHKEFIVLDRPDPLGFYVAGPILNKEVSSFVGKQCIPIVYGMTAGEYARMLCGEQWFEKAATLQLKVILCAGYTHQKKYKLPVAPSPNLRNMASVYAYPTLCLFEGTPVSVGRGTDHPFGQFGCPQFKANFNHYFIPTASRTASKPVFEGDTCWGIRLPDNEAEVLSMVHDDIHLDWIIHAYEAYPDKEKFFTRFFRKLAGTIELEDQIKRGMNAYDIQKSWNTDIEKFKTIRKKYLLYP